MSWKKNILSYITWLLFVLLTGFGVLGCVDVLSAEYGLPIVIKIGISAGVILLAAILVFAIDNMMKLVNMSAKKNRTTIIWHCLEAVLVLGFLVSGLILRIQNLENAGEIYAYFEMAVVDSENSVPQVVHGAVYLYLQLLHTIFYFLGNKLMAVVWLQIGLQLGAIFLLYCGIKKAAGRITALFVLAFCALSPYMILESVTLSPVILYLFFFVFVFCILSADQDTKPNPFTSLMMGILCAVLTYFDIIGVLLILYGFAVIFRIRNAEVNGKQKLTEMLCQLFGVIVGFVSCLALDAYLSSKSVAGILSAWLALFQPDEFRTFYELESSVSIIEYSILFGCMALGIFSFWRKKTDNLKVWIVGYTIVTFGIFCNIFTENIPGKTWLFFMTVVLAGLSIENCFCRKPLSKVNAVDDDNQENKQQESQSDEKAEKSESNIEENSQNVELLENPLPLPKKHEKKIMDFQVENLDEDDFDFEVSETDDFDIK